MGRIKGKKLINQGQKIPIKKQPKIKKSVGRKKREKANVRGKSMLVKETQSENVTIVDLKNENFSRSNMLLMNEELPKKRKNKRTLPTKKIDFVIDKSTEKDFVVVTDNESVMLVEAQTDNGGSEKGFIVINSDKQQCEKVNKEPKNPKKNKRKKGKEIQNVKPTDFDLTQSRIKDSSTVFEKNENLCHAKQRNPPVFESEFVKKSYDRNLERETGLDKEQVEVQRKMLRDLNKSESETRDYIKQMEINEGEKEMRKASVSSDDDSEMNSDDSEAFSNDDILDSLERQEALFKVFGQDQTELGSCGAFGAGSTNFKFPKTVTSTERIPTGSNDSGLSNDPRNSKNGDSVKINDDSKKSRKKNRKRGSSEKSEEMSQDVFDLENKESRQNDRNTTFDSEVLSSEETLGFLSFSLPKQESAVVVLKHPQELCIQGKATVTMLTGCMEIMGHRLKLNKEYKVFSPLSNSYAVLKTKGGTSNYKEISKQISILIESKKSDKLSNLETFQNEHFVSFIVRPIDSEAHAYLSGMSPFNGLFSIRTNEPLLHNKELLPLGIGLFPREYVMRPWITLSKDVIQILELWETLLSRGDKSVDTGRAPVLLICGGKNSGKSTLNRHLINTALNCVDNVSYLELDVGQTEFSPPGCLSLNHITEPVLGPPFTHLRRAERMCFYGSVNAAVNVSQYTRCAEFVFAAYKGDNPLIVNTMGWNKGVGVKLLVDVLHITNPDIVVQINSYRSSDNLPPVTPHFKHSEEGWLYNRHNNNNNTWEGEQSGDGHELCLVQTPVRKMQEKFITWTPADHRNVTLLSYLCQNLCPGQTLPSLSPYTVPWSAVGIHVCNSPGVTPAQSLFILNGSVVGLCEADLQELDSQDRDFPRMLNSSLPLCHCLGLGLVRGIDPVAKLLYIVTPLSLTDLASVNLLVKGGITLPDQITKHQKTSERKPYWDSLSRGVGSWKTGYKERKMRRPGAAFRGRHQ